jgi:hypothetical protein
LLASSGSLRDPGGDVRGFASLAARFEFPAGASIAFQGVRLE